MLGLSYAFSVESEQMSLQTHNYKQGNPGYHLLLETSYRRQAVLG